MTNRGVAFLLLFPGDDFANGRVAFDGLGVSLAQEHFGRLAVGGLLEPQVHSVKLLEGAFADGFVLADSLQGRVKWLQDEPLSLVMVKVPSQLKNGVRPGLAVGVVPNCASSALISIALTGRTQTMGRPSESVSV